MAKKAKTINPQTMASSGGGNTKPKNKKSATRSGGVKNGFKGRAA